tara:strand:- start:527 stop:817 length:291 start_codon:yes stop_codon:yes gene_type:complete
MTTLIQQDENGFDIINEKIYQSYGIKITKQVFVIDRYFMGVNGWTYAESYTDTDKLKESFGDCLFNLNGDDEDLFLKRNQQETPTAPEYIRFNEWA